MSASNIIRSDDLRTENRYRILNTLRLNGPRTQAELGQLTGLSPAAISTLTAQLIEQGILLSQPYRPPKQPQLRGRPQLRIMLNPAAGSTVTISLTIDQLRTQLIDYAGHARLDAERSLDTRKLNRRQLLQAISDEVSQALNTAEANRIMHIGVGFQGMTENASGKLLWSPIISEQNIPLADALCDEFKVEVSVSNDCQLIATALSRDHADVLGTSFATVLFSHGVGLGLYLNGLPFTGIRSSAMELGHLTFKPNGALCRCGKRGCIEAYAADYGIVREALSLPAFEEPKGRVANDLLQHILHRAQAKDVASLEAFQLAGAAVGEGLATLFTLIDPLPVALVGRNDDMFDLMLESLKSTLKHQLRDAVRIGPLLHCFDAAEPLLECGLNYTSLCQLDRQFAPSSAETIRQAKLPTPQSAV